MTIVNAKECYINTNCFYNCNTITSVDLSNQPWVNNTMCESFRNCFNLTSVTNINNNVIDMSLSFANCTKLVNAPTIPSNVTNLCGAFGGCTNLVNTSIIPNSVTTLEDTFTNCTNLVTAPIIPDSVTMMDNTFYDCTNLRGDIIINSTNVQYCFGCFMGCDTYNKYVWIKPNTTTWNSFIHDGGYDTNGTQNKVFMKEWDGTFSNLTVNVTPNTANVNIIDQNDVISYGNYTFNIYSSGAYLYGNMIVNIYDGGSLITSNTLNYVSSSVRSGLVNFSVPSDSKLISGGMDVAQYTNFTSIPTLPYNLVENETPYISLSFGTCCVPEYAQVKKENGDMTNAGDIKIGDIIYAYDLNNKEVCLTKVLGVDKPMRDHIIRITLDDNSIAEVTKEHVIYTEKGWAAYSKDEVKEVNDAVSLLECSKLLDINGQWKNIKNIEYINYPEGLQCINIKTEADTYFANNYLVHNAPCPGILDNDVTMYLYLTSSNNPPSTGNYTCQLSSNAVYNGLIHTVGGIKFPMQSATICKLPQIFELRLDTQFVVNLKITGATYSYESINETIDGVTYYKKYTINCTSNTVYIRDIEPA